MIKADRNEKFVLEEAISVLEATPAALRALLEDLPDNWLEFQEDPEAWNPRTVLVHYIHNELENWMPRLHVISSNAQDRRFAPFQQMPELSVYEDEDIKQLLANFADLRQKNLSELRKLDLRLDDLTREAEHPVLGVVNLGQLLATWVVHDLNHQHQIVKSMANLYRDAVGPWRSFLPILDL
jgi:hypothetical protein